MHEFRYGVARLCRPGLELALPKRKVMSAAEACVAQLVILVQQDFKRIRQIVPPLCQVLAQATSRQLMTKFIVVKETV